MKSQLEKNRPKNYQPIKEVLACLRDFKKGTRFKLASIDGYYVGRFIKYEDKVLYYNYGTKNPVVDKKKIHKVALHRIRFIM